MKTEDEGLTAKGLYPPLLLALGALTSYRHGVGVPRKDVEDYILRQLEIDPEDPKIKLTGRRGFCRRTYQAFWHHTSAGYRKSRPTCRLMGTGVWGLTKHGVDVAVTLRDAPPKPKEMHPNFTTKWIGERYPELMDRIQVYLRRKLPLSRNMGNIEDNVHTFLADMMARDGLRPGLKKGIQPTIRQMCMFAYNSALSQMRSTGKDAACRCLRGTLTVTDLNKGQQLDPMKWTTQIVVPNEDHRVVREFAPMGWNPSGAGPVVDVYAGDFREESQNAIDARRTIERIIETIKHRTPKAGGRYARIFIDRYINGMTVSEIAETQHVSVNRAAVLLRVTRRILSEEGILVREDPSDENENNA